MTLTCSSSIAATLRRQMNGSWRDMVPMERLIGTSTSLQRRRAFDTTAHGECTK